MITLVEALNYRCLRYVSRPLNPFHVLVGPNASGKTTFLDVVGFLRDLVSEGLDEALSGRTTNPEELLFRRQGEKLELAVEARIPDELRELTAKPEMGTARYEVAIGFDETKRQFEFKAEKFLLKKTRAKEPIQHSLFPMPADAPVSLLTKSGPNYKTVVNKVPGGNDNFYSEIYPQGGKGWAPSFKLGPQKSALGNLPADEKSLPVASWFREYLSTGVQQFVLNSLAIRHPSPPTRVAGFLPDGSNLPWVVDRLRRDDKQRYRDWITHLQTALADLVDITTIERPEDKHRYMVYEYSGGLKVPSWMVSDGTLRLTALTLPAYLDDLKGIYLIEEPENGIHPRAVATVYDSLSSVYAAQVLLATHSPVVLSEAKIDDVLCFAKDHTGATDIVLGSKHPKLQQWHGEADLGTLLASGVLG
ncbi:MAG: ATP-binding protein [Nitrospinae bacterium]|nr:ATP-binding protein [Nitrospinota bacterium]